MQRRFAPKGMALWILMCGCDGGRQPGGALNDGWLDVAPTDWGVRDAGDGSRLGPDWDGAALDGAIDQGRPDIRPLDSGSMDRGPEDGGSPDRELLDPDAARCVPAPERCDGADQDCDGVVDEGFGELGAPCSVGVGACGAAGGWRCAPDGVRVVCDGTPGVPLAEVCNGLDDDCDGALDEAPEGGPLTRSCFGAPDGGPPVGACRAGFSVCAGGAFSECFGEVGPSSEACDGVDRDCNGVIDDVGGAGCACAPGVERPCYPADPATLDHGDCAMGVQRCDPTGLRWLPCDGAVVPRPERCDGQDEDCDGVIDDVDAAGLACVVGPGDCQLPGELACAAGALLCRPFEPGGPRPEVCDRRDNDCDGIADELPGLGEGCTIGLGRCAARGVQVCDFETGEVRCDAPAIQPQPERCDGFDDDCDGVTDEDPVDCLPEGQCGAEPPYCRCPESLVLRDGACAELDACDPNPCGNQGRCLPGRPFVCDCADTGFFGPTCRDVAPLGAGGCDPATERAVPEGEGFRCECAAGLVRTFGQCVDCAGYAPVVRTIPIDNAPVRPVVGAADVDLDGLDDLLYGSSVGDIILWARNLGDGGFAPPVIIQSDVVWSFTEIIPSDVDGDGAVDLTGYRRHPREPQVSEWVWLRNRGGRFDEPQRILDGSTAGMQVVDFDGDGRKDWVFGTAAGLAWVQFGPAPQVRVLTVTGRLGAKISVGDLDGDGQVDIAAPHDQGFRTWRVRADQTLEAPRDHLAGESLGRGSSFADLDGDGDQDVLLDDGRWLPNNDGAGAFVSVASLNGGQTYQAVAEDFDQDGRMDVAFSSFNGIAITLSREGGRFTPPESVVRPQRISRFVVGHFDADGRPDLLPLTGRSIQLNDHAWQGRGVRLPETGERIVAIADLNRDGRDDYIAFDGELIAMLSGGPLQFEPRAIRLGPFQIGGPPNYLEGQTVHVFDADGDLDLDLLFIADDGRVHLLTDEGARGYLELRIAPLVPTESANLVRLDLDGDGDRDALFDLPDGQLQWFEQVADGLVFREAIQAVRVPRPARRQVADLNGDGLEDLFEITAQGRFRWRVQMPPGFGPARELFNLTPGLDFALGDTDGDGDVDLVTASDIQIALGINDGAGNLAAVGVLVDGTLGEAGQLKRVDVDGDGVLDLLRSGEKGGWASWLRGPVLNVFHESYLLTSAPWIDAGDFDGDGALELLTGPPWRLHFRPRDCADAE